ncbi:hypothetical protein BaRGS_00015916 [Batillaria attramentaria]|uniref:Uncharacterized protein n=1 Tax=Batillaria attramentaria TaxID=370345 RepID=A0ABD0L0H3_9CAEN
MDLQRFSPVHCRPPETAFTFDFAGKRPASIFSHQNEAAIKRSPRNAKPEKKHEDPSLHSAEQSALTL